MKSWENLRNIREDRGYTQAQIAEVIGTGRTYYSEYENGARKIPIEVYIKLADFYNVTVDYLCGRTKNSYIAENINITQKNKGGHNEINVDTKK